MSGDKPREARPKKREAVAFGQMLITVRTLKGWTPQEAALRYHVNPKTYLGYEESNRRPRDIVAFLRRLIVATGVSPYLLLDLPEPDGLSHEGHALGRIYDSTRSAKLKSMDMEVAQSNLKIDERQRGVS